MKRIIASLSAALFSCSALLAAPIVAQAARNNDSLPAGGKYKHCHGYIRHVSAANLRVHCVDGRPSDLSFISFPRYAVRKLHGKTVQDVTLKEGTPVHVIFTQSLGVRHAYKVYVADPNGQGLFGFKT